MNHISNEIPNNQNPPQDQLTHFSLFSGIGGIDLAAHWAGFQTVGFCEKEPYCQKVLNKHWPGVPIWEDIRNVTRESVEAQLRKVVMPGEAEEVSTIDLISGGFPCQPFSNAGKRRGKDDDRFLWPQMLRAIDELRPRAVIGENVDGIVNMALDNVLSDLEAIGYKTGSPIILPAAGVGASHRRYRVFIVAYSKCAEWGQSESAGYEPDRDNGGWSETSGRVGTSNENGGARDVADPHNHTTPRQREYGGEGLSGTKTNELGKDGWDVADTSCQLSHRGGGAGPGGGREFTDSGADVADTKKQGLQESEGGGRREQGFTRLECDGLYARRKTGRGPTQPGLGGNFNGLSARMDQCRWPAGPGQPQYSWEPPRIASGVKHRKDRLKALGNAVVPYQIFPVLYFMAQIIRAMKGYE